MTRHRFDPVRDLFMLQNRMNRLFEEAADRRTSSGEEESDSDMERADWVPAADILEGESEFTVLLDLPGIRRDSLDVSLYQGRLTVRGERTGVPENLKTRRSERPSGRFVRSFTVPEAVDRERVAADYKDGILKLTLPRSEQQKPRKVKIDVR